MTACVSIGMADMDPQLLATYLIAVTLLSITPGVDTLLVIRNAARGGWRDGMLSSLGICSGLFVHAMISAVGISVILLQTSWAFSVLKLCGAAYLIWLGMNNWRNVFDRTQAPFIGAIAVGSHPFKPLRSLQEGFLSNVLNPKTAVFYMAFLPHFINPAESAMLQSLALAGIHFVIAMVWQCALALAVNRAKALLQKPRVGQVFGGLTGSLLIGLGIKLAVDN